MAALGTPVPKALFYFWLLLRKDPRIFIKEMLPICFPRKEYLSNEVEG